MQKQQTEVYTEFEKKFINDPLIKLMIDISRLMDNIEIIEYAVEQQNGYITATGYLQLNVYEETVTTDYKEAIKELEYYKDMIDRYKHLLSYIEPVEPTSTNNNNDGAENK